MQEEELMAFLKEMQKSIIALDKKVEQLDTKITLMDLTNRLKNIQSMVFSENILHVKADENRENIFKHILYIYFYRNTNNNFNHWSKEIANFINTILGSRVKKGGKNPTHEKALEELLSNTYLLEGGLHNLLSQIIKKEGPVQPELYRGKEEELKDFVIETLKKIFELDTISGENIEELLSDYNRSS